MNRLDYSDIFDKEDHNIDDMNKNFEALDALYFFLNKNYGIEKVTWLNNSNYDLSFKIKTSKKLNIQSIDEFVHFQKPMELSAYESEPGITNINIRYKNSR